MKKNDNLASQFSHNEKRKDFDLKGYPLYPDEEDIYRKSKKLRDLDPEDITKLKGLKKLGKHNEKDFDEDLIGDDLDIPGVELEDEEEIIGVEDEENNYYSLGGDDHLDLEENIERF